MDYYYDNERPIALAHYILEEQTTIRATAAKFGLAKSTVHHDLSVKLKDIDRSLYRQVQKLMEENFSVKHIHGGESTKHKFAQLKNATNKFSEFESLNL